MLKVKKLAAAFAATGLAAFGAAAVTTATAQIASAATNLPITSCNIGKSILLELSTFPTCTAGNGTAYFPTSITVSVQASFFQAIEGIPGISIILGLLHEPLAENVTYTLSCQVNGQAATYDGSFQATTTIATESQTVDLATAVGSPEPTQCTVENLTATSLLALNSTIITALADQSLAFGASATADTTIPGAIYANYPADRLGARAVTCADDTGNGNSGTSIQAYQCLSDLADQWIQVSTHQFVHNGECLTDSAGSVSLENCVVNPTENSGQIWIQQHLTGEGTLSNPDGDGCLTAPASGTIDTATLQVATCAGAVGQEWTIPAVTT
jgi:Ricin-type beta-trefoil lectin domain